MENLKEIEILLVEDNASDIELTLRELKKHNLADKIHVLKDGGEALEYIFSKAYSGNDFNNIVVLLDLKLPKVDGLEVLKTLKSNQRTNAIHVIVLTSSAEEQDIIESYSVGVDGYIVKPVDFDKFVKAVSEIGLS